MQQVSYQPKPITHNRAYIFLHALAFVIGFSIVFIVGWGGATTLLGQLFIRYKTAIAQIGGVILIIFGLATMNIIRIPWFYLDTRPEFKGKTGTFAGSMAMGLFFAAGWSPCIGATLGAILTLGFNHDTVWQSIVLSSGYSIGLGIPFLLLALGIEWALPFVKRMRKHLRMFQIITGLLIIIIGVLMIAEQMTVIARWALKSGLYIEDSAIIGSGVVSYLAAILAGLLSFLSPCVLPLVPAYLGYLSGHAIATTRQEPVT